MENANELVELEVCESAFNRRLHTFNIVNKVTRVDIKGFLWDAFPIYKLEISSTHELHNMVKSSTTLVAEFEKKILKASEINASGPSTNASESDTVEETIVQTLYFTSRTTKIGLNVDWKRHYKHNVIEELKESVENAAIEGSGFKLRNLIKLNVQVSSFRPLLGGSFIEAPIKLKKRGAIINVKNENDNMCFKWAILSCLHNNKIQKNANRLCLYKRYENDLNFDGIDFPVSLKDIDKFEKQNENISINVYFYDNDSDLVSTLRVSDDIKEKHIHLLMLTASNRVNTDGAMSTAGKVKMMLESDQVQTHYCWIKSLSRLIDHQLTDHGHKYHICDRCLNYFERAEILIKHYKKCRNECKIEMPKKDENKIEFENYKNQLKAPFIIYADTEAYLKPLDEEERKRVFSEQCSTIAYQEHKVYSVAYYFKCEYDDSLSYYRSSGAKSDCIEWFIEELSYISNFVEKQLKKNVPMKWEDWDDDFVFQNNNHCSICTLEFEPDDTRVRDHCHFTGKFRGPAHVSCNLNYQESREIPIIMHNLSGYDAHLFIKQLATQMEGDVNIIPSNSEQYISFTKIVNDSIHHPSEHKDKIKLKFLDSCRFMPAGLAELASLIPTEEKRILYKEFERKYSSELLHMLERKGVFPYDYVDSLDRLRETALPSKEQFYSKLYEEDIEDDEYEFAQQIWEKFGIKSLGEYAELYLKTDVLLLADVFENFRETCHKIYNLDPAHYYTAPGLSWDAMLKYTDVVIELITDVDMLLFVERGIRGGITQCNKRYVEANNKYMREGYDPNKKTNYLMYLDANNLYGHAMCQPLPISDYKWADFDLSNVDNMVEIIKNLSEDSDTGYIFEVDLDYPEHLHADHNDFPFCAERTKLPQQAFDILKDKASKYPKLLLTLNHKKNYVIHYEMLKLALRHGLVLKKVHRVLQFKPSRWLKSYIDLNTEHRKKAKNEFEKSFYKLLNNAIFGKTMENVRSRVDIRLANKWGNKTGARMLISQPNFKKFTIFDEELVAIELHKTCIKMNKPIAIGMCILDISKITMYSFLYDYLKPKYGNKCVICYTDTDAFIIDVETEDFYRDMRGNYEKFDTSDYPWPNEYNIELKNKKIPGLFKDELNGRIMKYLAAIRAKSYAACLLDKKAFSKKDEKKALESRKRKLAPCGRYYNVDLKKSKGVKKNVVKNKITFEDYVQCVLNKRQLKTKQNNIRSIRHDVFTTMQEKVALNPIDEKRYIMEDGINTLAWGNADINSINEHPMYQ